MARFFISACLGLALLALSACDLKPKSPQVPSAAPGAAAPPAIRSPFLDAASEEIEDAGYSVQTFKTGERFYKLYCTACHRIDPPPGGEAGLLAPPAFTVAHHYRQGIPDLGERVEAIARFTRAPAESPALLPASERRFGPMNPINLPEDQLEAIALFLGAARFESPD